MDVESTQARAARRAAQDALAKSSPPPRIVPSELLPPLRPTEFMPGLVAIAAIALPIWMYVFSGREWSVCLVLSVVAAALVFIICAFALLRPVFTLFERRSEYALLRAGEVTELAVTRIEPVVFAPIGSTDPDEQTRGWKTVIDHAGEAITVHHGFEKDGWARSEDRQSLTHPTKPHLKVGDRVRVLLHPKRPDLHRVLETEGAP